MSISYQFTVSGGSVTTEFMFRPVGVSHETGPTCRPTGVFGDVAPSGTVFNFSNYTAYSQYIPLLAGFV